jgi:hypothetical protein
VAALGESLGESPDDPLDTADLWMIVLADLEHVKCVSPHRLDRRVGAVVALSRRACHRAGVNHRADL